MKKLLKKLPTLLIVCTLLILPTAASAASCTDTDQNSCGYSNQLTQSIFDNQQNTCKLGTDYISNNCLIGNNCPAGSNCTADSNCPAGSNCTADSNCTIGGNCTADSNCPAGGNCTADSNCPAGSNCTADSNCPAGSNCAADSNCTSNTNGLVNQLVQNNSQLSFRGFDLSSILSYLGYNSDNNDPNTYQSIQNTTENNISEYAQAVINLVNEERAKENLPALIFDATLTAAAEIRANEIMVSFSHTRPDGSSCFTALNETDAEYTKAGENIAIGQSTPENVVNDWMNSPGHRANIMSADYTRIGVAALPSTNSQYQNYAWTQFFAN